MAKGGMNVVKGVTLGLLAGTAVGMVGQKMIEKNPNVRKKANKAMRTVSSVIDTAQYMLK